MSSSTPNQHDPDSVGLILRDFLKVIKVVCMYPADNSLPQSLRQSFAGRLIDMIEDGGGFSLEVDKTAILYNGEIVYRDRSHEENLAALLFAGGITRFTFGVMITVDDVYVLLDTFKTCLNTPESDRDLASLLWQAGLSGFSFTTAEDVELADYDSSTITEEHFANPPTGPSSGDSPIGIEAPTGYTALFEQGPSKTTGEISGGAVCAFLSDDGDEVKPGEAEKLKASEALTAMGFADVATTATATAAPPLPYSGLLLNDELKLSEEEEERLRHMRKEEAQLDMYESTSALVKEMFLQEDNLNGFSETAVTAEKVLSELVEAGRLETARDLLLFTRKLSKDLRHYRPRWSDRLQDIPVTACSRERLQTLAETLNRNGEITKGDLSAYLEVFDWQALGNITDLLGEFEHRQHREALCDYLIEKGRGKVEILARGMYDKRWFVVRNSVMILGHISDDRALAHLAKATEHEDRRVRMELVTALRHSPHEKAATLLRPMLTDSDEEIRIEALRAITSRQDEGAFQAVAEIVTGTVFEQLSPDNQASLLIAYSKLGKERAVSHLAGLITRFNPLRKGQLTMYRAAALNALAHNPSDRAQRLLLKLASGWRPDLKQQARVTLSLRRELLLGGSDDDRR